MLEMPIICMIVLSDRQKPKSYSNGFLSVFRSKLVCLCLLTRAFADSFWSIKKVGKIEKLDAHQYNVTGKFVCEILHCSLLCFQLDVKPIDCTYSKPLTASTTSIHGSRTKWAAPRHLKKFDMTKLLCVTMCWNCSLWLLCLVFLKQCKQDNFLLKNPKTKQSCREFIVKPDAKI